MDYLDGNRVSFWNDPWIDYLALSLRFPQLYRVLQLPNGSVSNHWDVETLSWSVYFRRLLKEEEVLELHKLLLVLSSKSVGTVSDSRCWNFFSKSLFKKLTAAESKDKKVFNGLWKLNSLKRIHVLIWMMLFGSLNCFSDLQRKLPSHCLSPSICPLCIGASEDL